MRSPSVLKIYSIRNINHRFAVVAVNIDMWSKFFLYLGKIVFFCLCEYLHGCMSFYNFRVSKKYNWICRRIYVRSFISGSLLVIIVARRSNKILAVLGVNVRRSSVWFRLGITNEVLLPYDLSHSLQEYFCFQSGWIWCAVSALDTKWNTYVAYVRLLTRVILLVITYWKSLCQLRGKRRSSM